MLVLDASILIKLFRDEADSPLARAAIEHAAENRISLLAPTILLYEVLAVALHYEVPFEIPLKLVASLKRVGFLMIEPTISELRKAEMIATTKAVQGFPELKDSVYHAVAIMRGGTFLTADRRHAERTKSFGSALLLENWRPG